MYPHKWMAIRKTVQFSRYKPIFYLIRRRYAIHHQDIFI